MRKFLFVVISFLAVSAPLAAQLPAPDKWKEIVAETMPLLGHRNWILIVDSAYPLQSSPGVETIETNAPQIEVIRHVLSTINNSIHVRPLILMDAELPYVPDADAPGASAYRADIKSVLRDLPIESQPHDQLIAQIAKSSEQFHVLVLKTNMTIPYTSVFILLDCKYWSADAEKRMRAKMSATAPNPN